MLHTHGTAVRELESAATSSTAQVHQYLSGESLALCLSLQVVLSGRRLFALGLLVQTAERRKFESIIVGHCNRKTPENQRQGNELELHKAELSRELSF